MLRPATRLEHLLYPGCLWRQVRLCRHVSTEHVLSASQTSRRLPLRQRICLHHAILPLLLPHCVCNLQLLLLRIHTRRRLASLARVHSDAFGSHCIHAVRVALLRLAQAREEGIGGRHGGRTLSKTRPRPFSRSKFFTVTSAVTPRRARFGKNKLRPCDPIGIDGLQRW